MCPHISIFLLTWKHIIVLDAFHCSVSPSVVFFQILVNKNTEQSIKETLMEMSRLAVFQNSTKKQRYFVFNNVQRI